MHILLGCLGEYHCDLLICIIFMFISLFFHHCLLLLEHEGWWKNNEIRKMFQVGDPFGKDHRVDEARYSGNSRLSSPELWKNYECLILPIKEPEAKKNANMSGAKGGKEKKKNKTNLSRQRRR